MPFVSFVDQKIEYLVDVLASDIDYYKDVENHLSVGLQGVLHLLIVLIATPSEYSIFAFKREHSYVLYSTR